MNRSRSRAALALAATTALMLGACGQSQPDKPLTRAQLIAKADPICRSDAEALDYRAITPARVVRFAARLAALEQRTYERLVKLSPPPELIDDWQLIVDGFQESAHDFRTFESLPHPLTEGRFEDLYGAVRKKAWVARNNGFKGCALY